MEKIGSVLWKPEGVSDDAFRDALLAEAPALARAGARRLRFSVVDGHVAAGAKVRVGRMDPPKAAFVGYWVDEADARGEIEARLARRAAKLQSFLVVESEPIPNTKHVAALGERTPGFNLVTCIEPKDGLSYDEFIERWHKEHRVVALETQSTFGYVRNEIVRALTPGAPRWDAIVEENFPIGALNDPAVFYDATGDPAKLRANQERMFRAVQGFLALDRVESHPMSEYVFAETLR
jgi:EthD domain